MRSAKRIHDPVVPAAVIVRVTWDPADALRWDYCFVEKLADGITVLRDVCMFHGNLIGATSGARATATFRVPGDGAVLQPGELPAIPTERWGTLCPLPPSQPVLYRDTPPDGVTVPVSTVEVEVFPPGGGGSTTFTETISLVHSAQGATHFAVETDELLRTTLRFGNATNGEPLAPNSNVVVVWRTGLGLEGNVGRDKLTECAEPTIASVWNPFDAANGRAPERADEAKRNAPEAYRHKQLRAVTLADYVARAEEVEGVAHAAAAYMWTGSWRTVRITIDPAGTEELSAELADRVAAHLEALRLIGEDLEIRPPVFVGLRIALVVCVREDVWPQDVRYEIEKELSDGWTGDGRRALFHPDSWTFGQPLFESEIAGRLQRIDGIQHIAKIEIRRFDAVTPGDGRHVEVGPSEIIQVHNDPDHMERGFIELTLVGGRQ